MFRKPPSKLEQLQDTVVHALDELRDAIADLPADRASKAAAEKLKAAEQARHHLAAAAAQRAEALKHRAGDAAQATASLASHGAHSALQTAHNVSHAAGGAISGAASSVAGAVSGAAGTIGGTIGSAAGNVAHSASDRWHSLRGHAADAGENVSDVAHESAAGASRNTARVVKFARSSVTLPSPVEIEEENSSSRWLWIGVGILAGAALLLLFAPGAGRRNRALLADKAGNLSRRAAGAIHERTANGPDDADDITIADRVRTELGSAPATRDMERFNVDCVDGLVTLRGPISDAALQSEIEKIVRAVRGVRDVKLDLLTDESEGDAPTFVG